jgi:hypothetical protein
MMRNVGTKDDVSLIGRKEIDNTASLNSCERKSKTRIPSAKVVDKRGYREQKTKLLTREDIARSARQRNLADARNEQACSLRSP